MPASSAMRATLTLSGQLPDQRSATLVTARPDEQLAPNRPILSALPLYMAMRCGMEAVGASTELSHHHFAAVAHRRPRFPRTSNSRMVFLSTRPSRCMPRTPSCTAFATCLRYLRLVAILELRQLL